MPKQVAMLPKDEHGYPIPFLVAWIDGKPDFKTQDEEKLKICLVYKRCHICGNIMEDGFWFVGDTGGLKNFVYVDPAMHEECARYALKVCPFLANPRAKHAPKKDPSITQIFDTEKADRSTVDTVLLKANKYEIVTLLNDQLAVQAQDIERIEIINEKTTTIQEKPVLSWD